MRICRVERRLPWLAAALLVAAPAHAQERQVTTISEDAQQGATVLGGGDAASQDETTSGEPEAKRKTSSLLIVPIPQSNPALGTGLTVAGMLFWNPNHSKQPWITGVGGMYTSSKSWGAAAFHSMSLAHDRFRVLAMAGYADVNLKFYGIGPDAGDRDVHVDIEDKGVLALAQAQYAIVPNLYVGARYEYLDLETSVRNPNPIFPDLNLPPLKSKLSALGPSIAFDTRDSSLDPHKGLLATWVTMFNRKDLGSDFDYTKTTLAANAYLGLNPDATLAVHGGLCAVSTGGPFYDLCMYGMGNDLRGYEAGRYRDRASWAAQAEWRQHLGGRFGAVFFAGVGGIAPDIGSLDETRFLPSAGMGLRWRASKSAGVNLHLDFAIGKDSSAIYFGVGEAF